jgi:hypothetical protein
MGSVVVVAIVVTAGVTAGVTAVGAAVGASVEGGVDILFRGWLKTKRVGVNFDGWKEKELGGG